MMSGILFSQLEFLARDIRGRKVKENKLKVFGGIQIVKKEKKKKREKKY
jgi:hypothetical protein